MDIPTETQLDIVAMIEKSSSMYSEHEEMEKQLAARAPAVVDKLVKAGLLKESQRAAAEKAALNPLKLLESLDRFASISEKSAAAPDSLGGADDTAKPKLTAEDRPAQGTADRKFLESFGLA